MTKVKYIRVTINDKITYTVVEKGFSEIIKVYSDKGKNNVEVFITEYPYPQILDLAKKYNLRPSKYTKNIWISATGDRYEWVEWRNRFMLENRYIFNWSQFLIYLLYFACGVGLGIIGHIYI